MAADKQGVITDYRESYAEFRSSVEGLSEQQMTKPFMDGWSLREVLGHIAGWQDQLGTGLERMARGERPTPEGVDWSDTQSWNNRFAEQVRSARPTDLLRDVDSQVQRFVAALQAIPDDRFGEGKTVNRLAAGAGFEHFREHAGEIQEARAAGKL